MKKIYIIESNCYFHNREYYYKVIPYSFIPPDNAHRGNVLRCNICCEEYDEAGRYKGIIFCTVRNLMMWKKVDLKSVPFYREIWDHYYYIEGEFRCHCIVIKRINPSLYKIQLDDGRQLIAPSYRIEKKP